MDLIGQCYLCGRPAGFTCMICGRLVCERYYDVKAKMCTNDSPSPASKVEKRRSEDDLLR